MASALRRRMLVVIVEEEVSARQRLAIAVQAEGCAVVEVADLRETEHVLRLCRADWVFGDLLVIALAKLMQPAARRVLIASTNELTPDEIEHQFEIERVVQKPLRGLDVSWLKSN